MHRKHRRPAHGGDSPSYVGSGAHESQPNFDEPSELQEAEGAGNEMVQIFIRARQGEDDDGPPDDPLAVAAAGMGGPSTSLPFADRIQASFGRFDVSDISAHHGDAAEEAAGKMGARAFAMGDEVAFADTPDLHTAAHEATHSVDQRYGVAALGGMGSPGDAHEQHADAVADAVVAGEDAEGLLDEVVGEGACHSGRIRSVQCDEGEGEEGDKVEIAPTISATVLKPGSGAEVLEAIDVNLKGKVQATGLDQVDCQWLVDGTNSSVASPGEGGVDSWLVALEYGDFPAGYLGPQTNGESINISDGPTTITFKAWDQADTSNSSSDSATISVLPVPEASIVTPQSGDTLLAYQPTRLQGTVSGVDPAIMWEIDEKVLFEPEVGEGGETEINPVLEPEEHQLELWASENSGRSAHTSVEFTAVAPQHTIVGGYAGAAVSPGEQQKGVAFSPGEQQAGDSQGQEIVPEDGQEYGPAAKTAADEELETALITGTKYARDYVDEAVDWAFYEDSGEFYEDSGEGSTVSQAAGEYIQSQVESNDALVTNKELFQQLAGRLAVQQRRLEIDVAKLQQQISSLGELTILPSEVAETAALKKELVERLTKLGELNLIEAPLAKHQQANATNMKSWWELGTKPTTESEDTRAAYNDWLITNYEHYILEDDYIELLPEELAEYKMLGQYFYQSEKSLIDAMSSAEGSYNSLTSMLQSAHVEAMSRVGGSLIDATVEDAKEEYGTEEQHYRPIVPRKHLPEYDQDLAERRANVDYLDDTPTTATADYLKSGLETVDADVRESEPQLRVAEARKKKADYLENLYPQDREKLESTLYDIHPEVTRGRRYLELVAKLDELAADLMETEFYPTGALPTAAEAEAFRRNINTQVWGMQIGMIPDSTNGIILAAKAATACQL
ncbi:MAG: DUF4157 domain-containing protein, partial [Proteobacteria bacterium]|nr:DUF4157 domain-containing protein [Pseudomonadota bacterium]